MDTALDLHIPGLQLTDEQHVPDFQLSAAQLDAEVFNLQAVNLQSPDEQAPTANTPEPNPETMDSDVASDLMDSDAV
jgi:hypothetical protein